ncbi:family 16 glycosylhydrolase [Pseudobutyrivibrio xylanivorans]|uniref:Beta-glucanase n=1 Tax=Pseudobutyrivibrio xylanivorans TaxID=185007 RepID=A0A5P6VQ29_PSEXY|nr:family 16 glycosylhydrolase [Pseudobutyrivibrio xylanivorans]QFJ54482.1 endo-1,3(4)-beta-glucanase [Pseudobutyrivibrio xylanivorans]
MKKKWIIIISAVIAVYLLGIGIFAAIEISSSHALVDEDYKMELNHHNIFKFVKSDWANGGDFDCVWTPDNVDFSDGKMILTVDKNAEGYTGGEYSTNKTFLYGLYQVRMKPIKNTGVISSFFTYIEPTDEYDWNEIDIEFLGKDTTQVQFNYYDFKDNSHEYLYDLGFDASEDYHTYGFYWGKDSITWYVDGEPVYTAEGNTPNKPCKIFMNVWPGKDLESWVGAYDGTTPLNAYYEWASYQKVSSIEEANSLAKDQ